jgi:MPBQ/MSBQ methyltransferase
MIKDSEHDDSLPPVQIPFSRQMASLFNPMAADYDDIEDFWYSWLFTQLHSMLFDVVSTRFPKPRIECLDVGCGTGFQTILLAAMGHSVNGFDIAEDLVRVAAAKSVVDFDTTPLFSAAFPFSARGALKLRRMVNKYRGSAGHGQATFSVADAARIPFASEKFQLVNCCGSTLNFIPRHIEALLEMHRVLKPGGIAFLEVENRFNLDLLWALADSLTGGRLGYDQSARESWHNLTAPRQEHVTIEYPLTERAGTTYLPMRLFSLHRLRQELDSVGFSVESIQSIHSITNVIPSPLLDEPAPNRLVRHLAGILAPIEASACSWPGIRGLGCSVVLACRKGL